MTGDASLLVDHHGNVHGCRSGAHPDVREAIKKIYTYHLDRAPCSVKIHTVRCITKIICPQKIRKDTS